MVEQAKWRIKDAKMKNWMQDIANLWGWQEMSLKSKVFYSMVSSNFTKQNEV